ncbi:unnamed protein product, partial [Anisakis simplex]|uniref:Ovule protein n=1 Tax=Anisakis simplex TaxID=6269 RepID=A0A0M3JM39_ANISI
RLAVQNVAAQQHKTNEEAASLEGVHHLKRIHSDALLPVWHLNKSSSTSSSEYFS